MGTCTQGAKRDEVRCLPGSATSLDDLAGTVLAALSVRDTARLDALRLTEQEHNELVWPELPASNPRANFPVDLAWANIDARNHRARRRLLDRYGGAELHLLGVECRGGTRRFESFHVLTDCVVRFRMGGGEPEEAQLFEDVLVMDGEFKIFRYYAN